MSLPDFERENCRRGSEDSVLSDSVPPDVQVLLLAAGPCKFSTRLNELTQTGFFSIVMSLLSRILLCQTR